MVLIVAKSLNRDSAGPLKFITLQPYPRPANTQQLGCLLPRLPDFARISSLNSVQY